MTLYIVRTQFHGAFEFRPSRCELEVIQESSPALLGVCRTRQGIECKRFVYRKRGLRSTLLFGQRTHVPEDLIGGGQFVICSYVIGLLYDGVLEIVGSLLHRFG